MEKVQKVDAVSIMFTNGKSLMLKKGAWALLEESMLTVEKFFYDVIVKKDDTTPLEVLEKVDGKERPIVYQLSNDKISHVAIVPEILEGE